MIITESEMTKEDCDRINKELTRVRKEQGITLVWTKEYLEGLMPTCPPEPKEWSELVELWKECREAAPELFWTCLPPS